MLIGHFLLLFLQVDIKMKKCCNGSLPILWLESESGAELHTLTELHSRMTEFSDGLGVYTIKRLKQKLQKYYQEHIFFANVEGRENSSALETWQSLSSMKSGIHQGTAWRMKPSG